LRGGGADDALRFAERTATDPALAAARFRALTGRMAVGCLPRCVPEEILHAAGMLPVTVTGDEYGDFPGPWDVLDAWVFPPLPCLLPERETFLSEAVSARPRVSLRIPGPAKELSAEEALDRIEMFREWAGVVSGRPVTEGSLSRSVAAYNVHRSLFIELEGSLSEFPGLFAAREALWLVRSAMALPKEAHSLLLGRALTREPAPGRRIRSRIFVAGRLPSRSVMEAIDGAGAALVGVDFLECGRACDAMVEETGDPALSLARRLLAQAAGSAEAGKGRPGAAILLDRVAQAGADRLLYLGTGDFATTEEERELGPEAGRRGIPFLRIDTDVPGGIPGNRIERIGTFAAAEG
jgi:benzoyl-CoA reductase subunit C